MDYEKTLAFLYQQLPMYHRIGAAAYKANLDNTLAIDTLLGHPHLEFPTIHIAGTNGKGSVAHMLASVLQHAGYRTGLYTSPHLLDFRERIRVNGKMIPKKTVREFVGEHEKTFGKIRPSFFEWTVGLAFDHFRRCKVDVAVVETGLGGRLDSTNIITPELSVITNVSMDHGALLGGTVRKIAREKAGIIKKGIPVVIGESQSGITDVFVKKAKSVRARVWRADRLYSATALSARDGLAAEVRRKGEIVYGRLRLDLAGGYQLRNACTVLAALEVLEGRYPVSKKALRDGLSRVAATTGMRGRWEVLSRNPLTIADAAHNEAGLREVVRQLRKTPHHNLHVVLGLSADKDPDALLRLLPGKASYYFCKAGIPRGLDPYELAMHAVRAGLSGSIYPSVRQACRAARQQAGRDDLVFVGGSIFTIAEAL